MCLVRLTRVRLSIATCHTVPGDNFYLGDEARSDPERGGRYLRFAFVRSLDVLNEAAAKLAVLAK